jgi:FlaG protein
VKVDSPPPVTSVGGSDPTPATDRSAEKPAKFTAPPASAGVPDLSLSSGQQPQQLSVSYQVAENGHKVYFKVIDENSGQVVLQVPPSAVLSSEEKLYQFLKDQQQTKAEANTDKG